MKGLLRNDEGPGIARLIAGSLPCSGVPGSYGRRITLVPVSPVISPPSILMSAGVLPVMLPPFMWIRLFAPFMLRMPPVSMVTAAPQPVVSLVELLEVPRIAEPLSIYKRAAFRTIIMVLFGAPPSMAMFRSVRLMVGTEDDAPTVKGTPGPVKDEFYGSLREVYREHLKAHDFLFIHASFLVNYGFVKSVSYNCVHVKNPQGGDPTPLPVSRGRKNGTRARIQEIMMRRMF